MSSLWNRQGPFVAFAAVALLLVGCERWASLEPAPETPVADLVDGGGLQITEGETVRLLQYATHSGFETQGFGCDGDSDSLLSADPSIVAVHYEGRNRTVDVNSYETTAMAFVITGVKAGDVTLTGSCSDMPTWMTVRVVPRP